MGKTVFKGGWDRHGTISGKEKSKGSAEFTKTGSMEWPSRSRKGRDALNARMWQKIRGKRLSLSVNNFQGEKNKGGGRQKREARLSAGGRTKKKKKRRAVDA